MVTVRRGRGLEVRRIIGRFGGAPVVAKSAAAVRRRTATGATLCPRMAGEMRLSEHPDFGQAIIDMQD
jgi:hypothetical protein